MGASEPLVVIGPLKAGKTTVSKILASQLKCPYFSLDRLEKNYTVPAGFDPQKAESLRKSEGDWVGYSYRRHYFADAVEQFLLEHKHGVLELGGGHPIAPDDAGQHRITEALALFSYVFLLLPSKDISASLPILNQRQRPEWRAGDWNREFLANNHYLQLAKFVMETEGKSPTETAAEILKIYKGE